MISTHQGAESIGSVVELFAGCGGAARGLGLAGWRHLVCVERDAAASKTLRAAGFPALRADVRDLDWTRWAGRTDLLWGSPPCQPGSSAGRRRGGSDDRNGWPWLLDAVDGLRPTWLLSENVRGWSFHKAGCRGMGTANCVGCYWERDVLPAVASRFAFHGVWQMNAADFGVPQRRRRLILWAGPLPLSPLGPGTTHGDPDEADSMVFGKKPWRTVRGAIGDTLLDPHTCDRRHCYPCDGSYGAACTQPWRLDLPSPTVMTSEAKGTRAHSPNWSPRGGPDRASDAVFLAAGVRRIDVGEGLILQGFPADWPLRGTVEQRYRQVGNAVPPAMARAAGAAVAVGERIRLELGDALDASLQEALRRQGQTVPLVGGTGALL